MIVCDRCGEPVYFQSSFELKTKQEIKLEEGKMYPASVKPFWDCPINYDLCQECLNDVLKNLREFINQGKFKGELEGGSNG